MDRARRQAMDGFFRGNEQKAYLMALTLTRNPDDALELVQDSMLRLVQNYGAREPDEWGPLFHRILQNRIRDWFRRQNFRRLWLGVLPSQQDATEAADCGGSAEDSVIQDAELARIFSALGQLPLRQRQTFLLRAWQECSTRETAFVLSISENSVKTHYARATQHLRQLLGDEDG